MSRKNIVLTTAMLRVIKEHGPNMSDENIAALLRATTGPDTWTASKVANVRFRHGIKKSVDYVIAMRHPIPFRGVCDGTIRLMRYHGQMIPHIRIGPTRWVPYRRYVWEYFNGPLPKGFIVTHKDGDHRNCDPSNLEAMPRSEMMRRTNANRPEWSDRHLIAVREGYARYLEERKRKKAAEIYLAHQPYEFAT